MGEINIYLKLNMCAASHYDEGGGQRLHVEAYQNPKEEQHSTLFFKMYCQFPVCVCIFYSTSFLCNSPFSFQET